MYVYVCMCVCGYLVLPFFPFIYLDEPEQQWGSVRGPSVWAGCYRARPAAQPTAAATEQGYPCKQPAAFPQ